MRLYTFCWIILGGMCNSNSLDIYQYPNLSESMLTSRCFLYLFPSHQTWFLVLVLVLFMLVLPIVWNGKVTDD